MKWNIQNNKIIKFNIENINKKLVNNISDKLRMSILHKLHDKYVNENLPNTDKNEYFIFDKSNFFFINW